MTVRTPLIIGLLLANAAYADVILSEYIEGSSYNKAIELTNTGTQAVDLGGYSVELYSNGNTTLNSSESLSGTLAAGQAYVIANSQATAEILDIADITSAVTSFNGNDAVLLKNNGVVIDRVGQLGNSDYFGSNVTLVRNASITSGDSDYINAFDASIEWTSYPSNTFAYLGNTSDGGGSVEPPAAFACADPTTLISQIQGSGSASLLLGQVVDLEAIVIADLQASNQANGFFVQSLDSDADTDETTSEGLFIYHASTDVQVGDKVRIRGEVDEYYGMTQVNNVSNLSICSSGNTLPTPANITLPFETFDVLERVEGMQVIATSPLMVNEVYNLGRYGEFMVANGRRLIPTDVALPGDAADAVNTANDLNKLMVDDGLSTQNPETVIFPAPSLNAYNSLRIGDTVNNLTGVINFSYGVYKLIPTMTPVFNGDNPRTLEPIVIPESDLRIASFNVLNFFNGDGLGGGFPTDRGATTAYELERQSAKLVTAITAIDADVIGLMEIENDGFTETSAIAELVNAINAEQSPADLYSYVAPNLTQLGDDAIAVGIIYRAAQLKPVGSAALLTSANSPTDELGEPLFIDSLNRPALTQTFKAKESGELITLVVNHFKSKGNSNCAENDDCDLGQGAYNIARTNAANALTQWLDSNPTDVETSNVLIMGDLNAYSKEDPIQAIESAGFVQLKSEGDYSYVYDGEAGSLDQALASTTLAGKVINIQDWHINTDEPLSLDYNTEYKTDSQILDYYAPTAYRSSDHDPVIIDLKLNTAPIARISVYKFFGWYIFISDSKDKDGYVSAETWTLGKLSITKPWFIVSSRYVQRNRLTTVTLQVEDNDGAVTEVAKKFKR